MECCLSGVGVALNPWLWWCPHHMAWRAACDVVAFVLDDSTPLASNLYHGGPFDTRDDALRWILERLSEGMVAAEGWTPGTPTLA